ncbi:MAG: hypothetical protein ACYC2O_08480 [Microthrixaceae bacterium]
MRMTTAQRDIQEYRDLESLVLDGTEVTAVPRGRSTGLWGALALVAAPALWERRLPATDTSRFGVTETMFDYDAALAVDLDVALG